MKWYSISKVTKWVTDQYRRAYRSIPVPTTYDVHIVYSSQDFMEVFKLYMKKYLFSKYVIRESGIHPEGVPPETLFSSPIIRYALVDERLRYTKVITGLDLTTVDLISKIEKSMTTYMNRFIRHIYSTRRSCCFGCDSDWYLTRKYRHSYDFDTNKFTTMKKVSTSDGGSKLIVYVF